MFSIITICKTLRNNILQALSTNLKTPLGRKFVWCKIIQSANLILMVQSTYHLVFLSSLVRPLMQKVTSVCKAQIIYKWRVSLPSGTKQ